MSKKSQPFASLRCPMCGEIDSLKIAVETLTPECSSCGETVSRKDVEEMLAAWANLYAWLDSAGKFSP